MRSRSSLEAFRAWAGTMRLWSRSWRPVTNAGQRGDPFRERQSDAPGFAPSVQLLAGDGGPPAGGDIDRPARNLPASSDRREHSASFDAAAKASVASVAEQVGAAATERWMRRPPNVGRAERRRQRSARPVAAGSGCLAFRAHASRAGAGPRQFVPAAIEGFLPIVTTDAGIAAVSICNSFELAGQRRRVAGRSVVFLFAYSCVCDTLLTTRTINNRVRFRVRGRGFGEAPEEAL